MGRLSKEAKEAKTYDAIRAMIWRATQEFAKINKHNVDPVEVKVERSEKYLALEKILVAQKPSFNDGQAKAITTLFEMVTGEKMDVKEVWKPIKAVDYNKWVKHCAVIPVKQEGGHNYPLGTVAIMSYGTATSGILHDGSYGNTLGDKSDICRPATLDELQTITKYQFATLLREFFVAVPS